ncbi:MAG: hypothetical protein ACJA2Q_002338 [Pseudohongiellaceae bacterium]|jgi:hypothetical protein
MPLQLLAAAFFVYTKLKYDLGLLFSLFQACSCLGPQRTL